MLLIFATAQAHTILLISRYMTLCCCCSREGDRHTELLYYYTVMRGEIDRQIGSCCLKAHWQHADQCHSCIITSIIQFDNLSSTLMYFFHHSDVLQLKSSFAMLHIHMIDIKPIFQVWTNSDQCPFGSAQNLRSNSNFERHFIFLALYLCSSQCLIQMLHCPCKFLTNPRA